MKIAILGTKGIPNNYGGYEQFAEYISQALVARGHSVTVYNPSFHQFRSSSFNGVEIVYKYSPEKFIGGAANILYDFLCLRDALRRDFDIIYEAGYHSVALAYRMLRVRKLSRPIIVTNMDGLEYNRSKWNPMTQRIIKWLERVAVEDSPHMISDNLGIQEYYKTNFGKQSYFLPYGADPIEQFDEGILASHNVVKGGYFILVARFEPENNIECILDGFLAARCDQLFLVVGNHNTKYGKFLKSKYANDSIRFVGGIYNKQELDALRHYSLAYFHGHSVGGTNPSLLEAMASECFIVAHDNPFNRHVLYDAALYFSDLSSMVKCFEAIATKRKELGPSFVAQNLSRIKTTYNWQRVVDQHEVLFAKFLENSAS